MSANIIKAMDLYEASLKIKASQKWDSLSPEKQAKVNQAISEGKRLLKPIPN